MDVEEHYRQFRRQRHRPAHARRTAQSVAEFFLPLLRTGDRVVDMGCGPGSVTAGLAAAVGPTGLAIGVDVDPGPASVPLARADIRALPFPDRSIDAIFMCAVLQHVADPIQPLREARRIARPGAVIGVADADWGSAVVAPGDPWLEMGQRILIALRAGTSPYVGRDLRGLLHAAGFVDARVTARGTGGSDGCASEGAFQASFFEAAAAVDVVTARGLASARDMAAIAAAWRRWARDPAATSARHWFEATARTP
jgi:SAM-dependent methyltransferase